MLNCQLLVHLDEGVEQLAVNSPPSLGYQVQGSDVSLPQVLPCDLRVFPRLPAGGPDSAPKVLVGWHRVKRAGASQI